MARMTPEQRRAAIVDATLRVMIRQGIAASTARDVAAEMGTSSGLIHHYFASMDDLLAEAFDRVASDDLARTVAALDASSEPVERLAIFFAFYIRADEDWGMQLWLDAWSEAARRPALQQTSRRLNEAWQSLVADLIRDGMRSGEMTCDAPDAVAWRIISLLDGLALQAVAHADLVAREDANAWARGYAEDELALERGALRLRASHRA
ncbi:MAG: TetR family transcriptional regulator C-terminal domain-containing protein [Actinomycetia bacterium]|nr:TetR family transcriptional regulator C-terminal domain-containing protein [Actinomycetes bacterium]